MANRMILNETSYFGAGSISAVVDEAKSRAFKRFWLLPTPLWSSLVYPPR